MRLEGETQHARRPGGCNAVLGVGLLPKLRELHRRKWRDRKATKDLLVSELEAAAEQIAFEARGREFSRPHARDCAAGAVVKRGGSERSDGIPSAPTRDAIGAKMRTVDSAGGGKRGHREPRRAAACCEANEEVAIDLIVEATGTAGSMMAEVGAADPCLARKFP